MSRSPLLPNGPPRSVAVIKLSAIGDVCHTLPVIRTLQSAWPQARFTWIIGRTEAALLGGIRDIEFIILDKGAGSAGRAQLRRRKWESWWLFTLFLTRTVSWKKFSKK